MNEFRKTNILMLDDDLLPISNSISEGRIRLQPWLRWFKTGVRLDEFNLIEVNDVENFSHHLKRCENMQINEIDYIDAIIVDMMWKERDNAIKNFSCLGYPNTPIAPLEAGIQLISLMYSAKEVDTCYELISKFSKRKILVLTTLTGGEVALQNRIPDMGHRNLKIMSKKTELQSHKGESYLGPERAFQEWVYSVRQESITYQKNNRGE